MYNLIVIGLAKVITINKTHFHIIQCGEKFYYIKNNFIDKQWPYKYQGKYVYYSSNYGVKLLDDFDIKLSGDVNNNAKDTPTIIEGSRYLYTLWKEEKHILTDDEWILMRYFLKEKKLNSIIPRIHTILEEKRKEFSEYVGSLRIAEIIKTIKIRKHSGFCGRGPGQDETYWEERAYLIDTKDKYILSFIPKNEFKTSSGYCPKSEFGELYDYYDEKESVLLIKKIKNEYSSLCHVEFLVNNFLMEIMEEQRRYLEYKSEFETAWNKHCHIKYIQHNDYTSKLSSK